MLVANGKCIVVSRVTFLSNMGFIYGSPLSPTLFGLCDDKHEVIVNKVAKEEQLDVPKF